MEVETEAKVEYEEYEVEVKPLDGASAEVKEEVNVNVIGYQLLK